VSLTLNGSNGAKLGPKTLIPLGVAAVVMQSLIAILVTLSISWTNAKRDVTTIGDMAARIERQLDALAAESRDTDKRVMRLEFIAGIFGPVPPATPGGPG